MSLASLCHHYMLTVICRLPYLSVLWVHCLCKLQQVQLHFASIRSHSSWSDILALWGLTNRTPLLNWIQNSL